jgi:hypothetical protein
MRSKFLSKEAEPPLGALMENCQASGERFFRLYHKYCGGPDKDTLFNLLNSTHSLNDRLRKATGEHFFNCNEFVALKTLRNLFHHETELVNEVRIIPVEKLPSISTDLLFLCLVPSRLVLLSFEQLDSKRRARDEEIASRMLNWYGNVVNINPCMFNFAVHAFEKLKELGVQIGGNEYREFQACYELEEEAGHSHFVTGDISCHAGSVEQILKLAFANVCYGEETGTG